jgi:hypothetical protein
MAKNIAAVWGNGRIPVIAVPPKGEIKLRLPYSEANREWLKISQRDPRWDKVERCWFLPRSWLNRQARRIVGKFGRCYIVQSVCETETCSPACLNAAGIDCDCSCRGEHHGSGNEDAWFVINETFACRSEGREYSVRLVGGRPISAPSVDDLRADSGVRWSTYFARARGTNLVKIGRSTDVQQRIKSLQTGCPQEIDVIGIADGDCESNWHRRFSGHRRTGEWFELSDQDISQIEFIMSDWTVR